MKRTRFKISISAIFVLIYSVSAHAKWQFTEWGMTPDQVVTASNGEAKIIEKSGPEYVGNVGAYISGDYSFAVEYVYSDDKLNKVSLKLENYYLCESLLADLKVRYGQQATIERPIPSIAFYRWSDIENGNQIKLSIFSDTCFLSYSPLKGKNTSGL